MKKILFVLLVLSGNIVFAQQSLYQNIKAELNKHYPELKLENKIIVVNAWSVNDSKSREVNKEIEKTINTFGYAKLKGGSKGVIGVVINTDADKNLEEITLKKDKMIKTVVLSDESIETTGLSFVVYDSEGKEIYKELSPGQIYSSIQNLITR